MKDERFGIVTSIRGLPLGVRDGLQTLFGSQTLDIAEPGAEFQVTDVIANPRLPIRRLVAAGARPITASSTTSAAVSPTRGRWRSFTGRRPRLDSSGAVSRQAGWQQSTTFGRPSCRSDQEPGEVLVVLQWLAGKFRREAIAPHVSRLRNIGLFMNRRLGGLLILVIMHSVAFVQEGKAVQYAGTGGLFRRRTSWVRFAALNLASRLRTKAITAADTVTGA